MIDYDALDGHYDERQRAVATSADSVAERRGVDSKDLTDFAAALDEGDPTFL